jgi:hypothetical protein
VDDLELGVAVARFLTEKGYTLDEEANPLVDLSLSKSNERMGVVLAPDHRDDPGYLRGFEEAMRMVVDARRADTGLALTLSIAFEATAAGRKPSYRRALKKYSNSIVFEDLQLSLFLVTSAQKIMDLRPHQVNPFLQNLDTWIASRTSN